MNWSLHNTVPEPDRSLENLGFNGIEAHQTEISEKFPKGSSTNETFRFQEHIADDSNTTKREWPTPAGGNYGLRKY